ncbi:MAG: DsbA family protein [Pseudomonadota bacterium]
MSEQATLYYIHDPMCSWCWGFSKTWGEVYDALDGKVDIRYVVGGLAPDSSSPMPEEMQQMLQATWKRIQQTIPGTEFNFSFWTDCKPRRSTYPACRAVLAAKAQAPEKERPMIKAIQHAYYTQARNPSDDDVLIALAGEVDLNTAQFADDLNSDETQMALHADITLGQRLGAQGFPSMILVQNDTARMVGLDYNSSDNILSQIVH